LLPSLGSPTRSEPGQFCQHRLLTLPGSQHRQNFAEANTTVGISSECRVPYLRLGDQPNRTQKLSNHSGIPSTPTRTLQHIPDQTYAPYDLSPHPSPAMPAHGPIHLPVEEEDAINVSSPKVTTRGVAFEVLRTVSTASAFGLQVYSAICAKKFAKSHSGGRLPHRFDVTLWKALGTWQAQVAYAACLVSLSPFPDLLMSALLILCLCRIRPPSFQQAYTSFSHADIQQGAKQCLR
jgi:hypothetical protein